MSPYYGEREYVKTPTYKKAPVRPCLESLRIPITSCVIPPGAFDLNYHPSCQCKNYKCCSSDISNIPNYENLSSICPFAYKDQENDQSFVHERTSNEKKYPDDTNIYDKEINDNIIYDEVPSISNQQGTNIQDQQTNMHSISDRKKIEGITIRDKNMKNHFNSWDNVRHVGTSATPKTKSTGNQVSMMPPRFDHDGKVSENQLQNLQPLTHNKNASEQTVDKGPSKYEQINVSSFYPRRGGMTSKNYLQNSQLLPQYKQTLNQMPNGYNYKCDSPTCSWDKQVTPKKKPHDEINSSSFYSFCQPKRTQENQTVTDLLRTGPITRHTNVNNNEIVSSMQNKYTRMQNNNLYLQRFPEYSENEYLVPSLSENNAIRLNTSANSTIHQSNHNRNVTDYTGYTGSSVRGNNATSHGFDNSNEFPPNTGYTKTIYTNYRRDRELQNQEDNNTYGKLCRSSNKAKQSDSYINSNRQLSHANMTHESASTRNVIVEDNVPRSYLHDLPKRSSGFAVQTNHDFKPSFDSRYSLMQKPTPSGIKEGCCGNNVNIIDVNLEKGSSCDKSCKRNTSKMSFKNVTCACSDDSKVIKCSKKTCNREFNTSCPAASCAANQDSRCYCRYPPLFKQFSCVGNINGTCNCNDNY